MRRTTCVLLGVAALLAFGGASCGDDDDDDASPTTTTTETTEAPTTTLAPEDEVKAAYLAYRTMVTRLLQAPNPDDAEIAERTVGENQGFLVDQLTTLSSLGQALRFGASHSYNVVDVSVTGAEAIVQDCTVDDAQTVVAATGEVVSEGTTTELLEAKLELNGRWRVKTITGIQQWPGVTSCDG